MFVLLRQSPKAQGTALRFASRPVSGDRADVDRWRDEHNGRLSAGALKREGKVASAVLSDELLAEYEAFRGARRVAAARVPADAARGAAGAAGRRHLELSVAAAAAADDDERLPPAAADRRRVPAPARAARHQLVFASEGDLWMGEVAAEA